MQNENQTPNRFRAIWISDVHLGTRGCKAAALLDFLRHHDAETLYLVGDIFDGWQLRRSWFWTQPHNDVIQKILRKVRKGTRVYYLPGNHDEFAQDYEGLQFGGITVQREIIHRTADGRRLLVLHGDQFDAVVMSRKWLAKLGSGAYDVTILLNHWFNMLRRRLGMRYWSLSGYLKHKVKSAVSFIGDFERTLADEARRRHCDGVVCGHIHRPEMRMVQGILYGNAGDWVESCSALVERADGRLEILTWSDPLADATREPRTVIDKLLALDMAG